MSSQKRYIEELMLKPEYFPVDLRLNMIEVYPPVHPDMLKEDIDHEIALGCLDCALRLTAEELRKLPENLVSLMGKDVFTDTKDIGVIERWIDNKPEVKTYGDGDIEISPFPILIGEFVIHRDSISLGYDYFFEIQKEKAYIMYFSLPDLIKKEYGIKTHKKFNSLSFKGSWRPHEESWPLSSKIFCKNFAIAYANELVKIRYSDKKAS